MGTLFKLIHKLFLGKPILKCTVILYTTKKKTVLFKLILDIQDKFTEAFFDIPEFSALESLDENRLDWTKFVLIRQVSSALYLKETLKYTNSKVYIFKYKQKQKENNWYN